MRLKKFVENEGKGYQVRMAKPEKYKKINPRTNRMKKFKRQRFMSTDITPEDRSFKNQPKYADGKSKVKFQDWLEIKGEGGGKNSDGISRPNFYGKAANGKWYGWSHRAVYGFKAGDKITGDNGGKKVEYPKLPDGSPDFDHGKYEPDFTIKDDAHAREVAIRFADSVS